MPDIYNSHRETRDNLGSQDETRIPILIGLFNENLEMEMGPTKLESRDIASAFILGHSTNAIIGTSELGEDNIGSWTARRIINPKNIFHEHFRFDEFNDSTNTTGTFSTTYYNISMDRNEIFQTLDIFLNVQSIQYVTIYVDLTGVKSTDGIVGGGTIVTLTEGR